MDSVARLQRIERKRTALLDAVAPLSASQLDARPLPGKWCIRETVEHLVLVERAVVGDFAALDALPARPRRFKHRVRGLVVMFVLRFRIPVRVPSPLMAPAGAHTFAELRAMWDEHHRRLRAYVGGLDRAGAARAVFRHPIAGPLTVTQGIRMLDVHLDAHVRQIHRLAWLLRYGGGA
jgi:hypothetical protein